MLAKVMSIITGCMIGVAFSSVIITKSNVKEVKNNILNNYQEQTILIEKNHLEILTILKSKLRIDKEFLQEVKNRIDADFNKVIEKARKEVNKKNVKKKEK